MLELIERKAAGEEIAVQPEAPQPAKVPDLMAALEASLAAVKGDDGGRRQEARRAKSSRKKEPRRVLVRRARSSSNQTRVSALRSTPQRSDSSRTR